MEFLVLASQFRRQPERERIVMKAVIEVAEAISADLVVKRRGNVYSTTVYLKDGKEKTLVYNDWGKNWDLKEVYSSIMSSVQLSPILGQRHQIELTSLQWR